MALKIKRTPDHLEPDHRIETVWPGDEAVDAAGSDLVTWCRSGSTDGRTGLSIRPGSSPSIITWRPLGPRELMLVSEASGSGSATAYPFEAARYGIVSVSGVDLRRERRGGLLGLSDASLDALAQEVALVPYLVAIEELHRAQGRPAATPAETTLIWASIAEVVGVHILTASFRARRGPV